MITEDQIIAAVSKKPGIFAVQICDSLDCDIDDIEHILLGMVRRNQLVSVVDKGPNGRNANFYSIPFQFVRYVGICTVVDGKKTVPNNPPAQVLKPAPEVTRALALDATDPESEFVCCIWSNGDMELRRDGCLLTIIKKSEIRILKDMLSKVYV